MKMDNEQKEELEILEIEPKKHKKNNRIKKSEMSADALLDQSFVEPENKKGIIIASIVSIIILILIVLFVKYISGNQSTKQNNGKNDNVASSIITNKEEANNTTSDEQGEVGDYNEEYGSLVLYKTKDDKVIGEKKVVNDQTDYTYLGMYNCQSSECSLALIDNSTFADFDNNTVIINDGGIFMYNYETNIILTYKYETFMKIIASEKVYFIASLDGKTNIYSSKGNKITTDGYEEIGINVDNKIYSYDDNVIVAKKNGKWGLITIRTNETILDFSWDKLYLGQNNLYIAVKDQEYYVINNDGVQLTEEGYPLIVDAFDEFFVTLQDKKLDIKKYDGESLIKTPLDIYVDYDRYKETSGVKLASKNIVELEIMLTNTDGSLIKYIFNTGTYTIEQA